MNLWSELDNQQTPAETVKSGRPRRLTEDFVLSAMRAWLLEDYVLPYCRTLAASRIYKRCYWIDGWGGNTRTFAAGKANGVQPAKKRKQGVAPALPTILQPVVLLSALLAQEQRPIALNGLMLVAGSSRRKTGENDALVLPKESGLVRGSWQVVAPVLLKEIASSPALFLLNPFGPTLFTQDDLAPLYQRTAAPTELCLLMPHKQTGVHLLAAARTPEGAAQLTTLLRSDRWKTLLPQNGAKEGKDVALLLDSFIEMLVAELQRHFLTVQQIAFPLLTRPGVVETVPYTLLFATRSKESLSRMNDAVCLYERRVVEESFTGTLNEAWFVAQQQERFAEEQQQLSARMLQQGQAQRPRRWPDLRQQLLLAQFGHYTICEYDATINKLIAHGSVRCAWKRPQSTEEEKRVPGNDDMLVWR